MNSREIEGKFHKNGIVVWGMKYKWEPWLAREFPANAQLKSLQPPRAPEGVGIADISVQMSGFFGACAFNHFFSRPLHESSASRLSTAAFCWRGSSIGWRRQLTGCCWRSTAAANAPLIRGSSIRTIYVRRTAFAFSLTPRIASQTSAVVVTKNRGAVGLQRTPRVSSSSAIANTADRSRGSRVTANRNISNSHSRIFCSRQSFELKAAFMCPPVVWDLLRDRRRQ